MSADRGVPRIACDSLTAADHKLERMSAAKLRAEADSLRARADELDRQARELARAEFEDALAEAPSPCPACGGRYAQNTCPEPDTHRQYPQPRTIYGRRGNL